VVGYRSGNQKVPGLISSQAILVLLFVTLSKKLYSVYPADKWEPKEAANSVVTSMGTWLVGDANVKLPSGTSGVHTITLGAWHGPTSPPQMDLPAQLITPA